MKKAGLREQVLDAVIQKFYELGVDPVATSYVSVVDMVMIMRHDDPNGVVARFWNRASDHQWTLLQREFRVWQHNEPHRRALQRKSEV